MKAQHTDYTYCADYLSCAARKTCRRADWAELVKTNGERLRLSGLCQETRGSPECGYFDCNCALAIYQGTTEITRWPGYSERNLT